MVSIGCIAKYIRMACFTHSFTFHPFSPGSATRSFPLSTGLNHCSSRHRNTVFAVTGCGHSMQPVFVAVRPLSQ